MDPSAYTYFSILDYSLSGLKMKSVGSAGMHNLSQDPK